MLLLVECSDTISGGFDYENIKRRRLYEGHCQSNGRSSALWHSMPKPKRLLGRESVFQHPSGTPYEIRSHALSMTVETPVEGGPGRTIRSSAMKFSLCAISIGCA